MCVCGGGAGVWFIWIIYPQQQPGSYQGGHFNDDDDEMSVSLVEETGAPGGNDRPTASNRQTFTHTAYAGVLAAYTHSLTEDQVQGHPKVTSLYHSGYSFCCAAFCGVL